MATHNKLFRYLFYVSLLIAGVILFYGPGRAPAVTCDSSHERTCNGSSQADVDACINGGVDGGVTTWCKAADGDIIHLKAGTGTWTSAITVDKNVQIYGAGTGTGGTHINGGTVWVLKPHVGSLQPRFILSNMHINKDRTIAETQTVINVLGVCPINDSVADDPTQSGGFQISKNLFTATDGTVGKGHIFHFGGWTEGLLDHNVIDLPVPTPADTPYPSGEYIIVNFNGTPTNVNGTGFYAWSHPAPINDNHILTVEDNIFRRHGAFDSNQWSVGSAGGAMYRARHNTFYHGTSGHGGPSDSHVWGIRFEDAHKNLYVRGQDQGNIGSFQGFNMIDVRGGEAVAWGNRFNRYGVNSGTAANTFQVECNVISSGTANDMTGGPNGENPWYLNWKGHVTDGTNGINTGFNPDPTYNRTYTNPWLGPSKVVQGVDKMDDGSVSEAGDVYNWGVGGTMKAVNDFTLTKSGVVIHGQQTDQWKDFMVLNLSKEMGVSVGPSNTFQQPQPQPPSTQDYAYVVGNREVNGETVFSMAATNRFNVKLPRWAIVAGNAWEMRRVKANGFLNTPGHGPSDTAPDENTVGVNDAHRNALRLSGSGTPNPRWTNQPTSFGVYKWDNLYRIVPPPGGSWLNTSEWAFLLGDCAYACGASTGGNTVAPVGNGSTVPTSHGYTYNAATPAGSPTGGSGGLSGTELRPETRVGADTVAWTIVPADGFLAHDDDGCPNSPCQGTASFYEAGSGGPDYPHPFSVPAGPRVSASGPTFTIGGTDDCGASPPTNCVHIATSGFTSSPITITLQAGGWTPALDNGATISLTSTVGSGVGTVHGTASGNTAGSYKRTIKADTPTQHALAELSITLQSGTSPISVTLTAPKDGDHYTPTDTINFSADANGGNGITKVEFYEGSNLLNGPSGDATVPYTYSTTLASRDSPYVITAKAYDGSTSKFSDPANIQVGPTSAASPPAILQIKP